MKLLTLLSVVVVGVSGYLFKLPILPASPKIENSDWIHRQKLVLSLFENVCDISTDPAIVRIAQDFALDKTTGNFEDPNLILRLKEKVLLPKGEIFTEYDPAHIEELKTISEVLYKAQDFHTFYAAAAWARQNVNCGLFVDAIYLAIMKRKDTEKLSIPAPYELLPNYFINKDTIIKGSSLLSNIPIELGDNIRIDGNSYIIDTNYTYDIYDNNEQTKLAYFHEDIGLNTYYLLRKLSNLSWVKDANGIHRYGEHIFHIMKQLATRYDLERYANGFEEICGINWHMLDTTEYDPMLVYSNGQDFKVRSRNMNPQDILYLENIEKNITTAVNYMIQKGSDKIQILNNLIEILVTGNNNYEDIAHRLLGTDIDDVKKAPTVLDHYMTSMRDPIFWRLNKKIVNIIDDSLAVIPTYTKSELYFPGVKVINVDIKKMSTSFESFEFDVTDALKPLDSDSTFQIKVAQPRLNHKSFAIKVNITSLVPQKGLMKIFLGPKMLPGELALNQEKFMLLDTCEISLKKGGNIITRTSEEINNLSPDFWSLKTLRQNVEDAEFGIGNLPLENIQRLTGFPSRLIIPKGTEEGLPLEIFIFIAPFTKIDIATSVAEFNSAILSPRYPLDLTKDDNQLFDLPNAIVKEIIVSHKGSSGGKYEGKGKNWDSESYDFSAKKSQYGQYNYADKSIGPPELQHVGIEKITEKPVTIEESSSNLLQMRPYREPFDYKSKRQYGKRTDYASKLTEKLPSYNEEQLTVPSIQPHGMLEKKPFNVGTSKDMNKHMKETNGTVSINIGKNKNTIIPTKPLEDLKQNPVETVNINFAKNKDDVMPVGSTESNKVIHNIDKNKETQSRTNFVDKNKNDNNINFDKPMNYQTPNSFDDVDGNKSVKKNINKKRDSSFTAKLGDTDDESLISREKFHENIEDIMNKYFPPKLEQVPQSTKRIPSVYDYIVYSYDDSNVEQPKVYE